MLMWAIGAWAWCERSVPHRAGIAPYMAIELAVFDLIPRHHLPFARGFTAAFLATTACYPLDTVRCAADLLSDPLWS